MSTSLRKQQSKFARLIPILVTYIYACGYEVTFGRAHSKWGLLKGFHRKKLAIDLNLFKDGVYLDKTKDHIQFGRFWKSLHPECTWGGDFKNIKGGDGNHYSFGER